MDLKDLEYIETDAPDADKKKKGLTFKSFYEERGHSSSLANKNYNNIIPKDYKLETLKDISQSSLENSKATQDIAVSLQESSKTAEYALLVAIFSVSFTIFFPLAQRLFSLYWP